MRSMVRLTALGLLTLGLVALVGSSASAQAEKTAPKFKIKVTVPYESADLLIDGKATKTTGIVREFEIPPGSIENGKKYFYEFSAKWRPNNYTTITRLKTVEFVGGQDVVVDLTKEDPANKDKAVIRYVPTPDDVVAKMIELAKVGKDDVIFEPGCGDARITIAAVKAGAKRGVGIDLDPERVVESKANVKKAELESKIEIRQGDDLEQKDYSDATVMFTYMGNEFNEIFRPVLWRQLKPGTRIVSHRFIFGDWKPDQTIKVNGQDGDEYILHLWTITKELKDKVEPAKPKPAEPKAPETKEPAKDPKAPEKK